MQAIAHAKSGQWGPEMTLVQSTDTSSISIKAQRTLLADYVANLKGKTEKTNAAREAELQLGQLKQKV